MMRMLMMVTIAKYEKHDNDNDDGYDWVSH